MIHVARERYDSNGQPICPPQNWFDRAREATEGMIADLDNHHCEDGIYGHFRVRAALEELFSHKCAYCETRLPEATWNVEHFRPKGRIAENRDHPGYYWLTYEWTNLYPACVPCNQRRKDKPIWADLGFGITGGKADQFPLIDEGTRAYGPDDDLGKEKKLLLDPCSDDPQRHITFSVTGMIIGLDQYGKCTIRICNLKRRRLNLKRATKVKEMVAMLVLIREVQARGDSESVDSLKGFMNSHLLSNNKQYLAVARAVVSNPNAFGLDD